MTPEPAEANERATAPTIMAIAPPRTLIQVLAPAPRNSPNNNHPQKSPTRELMFQRGKAIARPTSRTATIVRVFATAQMPPASTAQTIRWGFCFRSYITYDVPLRSVGTVHRAKKTPTIMHSEITTGEKPVFTSFVGASAPPNHVEAAIAQKTPSPCMDRLTGTGVVVVKWHLASRSWRSDY